MSKFPYNINCDLGEEKNVEQQIMPLIQSANIACGAHAGNNSIITECIQLAKQNNVLIGIHPSYPDRENFGRIVMEISTENLLFSIKDQIDNFVAIAESEAVEIHHLKFHGALYNQLAKDQFLANKVAELLNIYPAHWIIYCPAKSKLETAVKSQGRKVWTEAFLDRTYNSDGSLVSRKKAGAVLESKEQVFEQFKNLVKNQTILSISGEELQIKAKTFCIHGDHNNSVEILKFINEQFIDGNL